MVSIFQNTKPTLASIFLNLLGYKKKHKNLMCRNFVSVKIDVSKEGITYEILIFMEEEKKADKYIRAGKTRCFILLQSAYEMKV